MSSLNYMEITQRISARRPLLMLDRAQIADDASSATAIKAVSMNEAFFQGHFPGNPIMPGVLQVAGMTQLASLLLLEVMPAPAGHIPWLKSISRYRFRKPVVPGDFLRFEIAIDEIQDNGIRISGKAYVNNDLASNGILEVIYKPLSAFAAEHPMPTMGHNDGEHELCISGITAKIPHRFPFLLLDRITHIDHEGLTVCGVKNVSGNESFMDGVGDCHPAMPGFLQVEAAAQASCVLALGLPENEGKLGLFASIDKAEFHAPALPGDQLVMDMALKNGRIGSSQGTIVVGDVKIADFELKFALV